MDKQGDRCRPREAFLAGSFGAVPWFVPKLRKLVTSVLREAARAIVPLFGEPRRALALFGSNFASQLTLGTTLWLTVLAFGSRVSLATALVIVVGNALLSGAAPTPGRVGSAAVLTAGLVGAGVDQNTAFAVTVTYRPASVFVPPLPGFFSLPWLERNGHRGHTAP